MKKGILDATPEKRIFLSIISEYDLKRSICELIDNAIDLWTKNRANDLVVDLQLDDHQQSIRIEDNAGGLEEAKLDHILSPGKTSNDITDDVIGFFGVGSKRAVVALAEIVAIHTRFDDKETFTVQFDENWIEKDPSWNLPYQESLDDLPPSTTRIELNKLRVLITPSDINNLKTHLSEIYSKFIKAGVTIRVNGETLDAISFDDESNWSYPPGFKPKLFKGEIPVEEGEVKVEILSGLLNHPGHPDDSYGVFLYCNDRLIARGLKNYFVGFAPGMAGNPHYNISLTRTVVKLKGHSRDMPWDGSKSGIDFKHPVFHGVRQSIIDTTTNYAKVSRSLQGSWDTEIFPYKKGKIEIEKLENIEKIPKNYLPKPPPSKFKWHEKVLASNATLLKTKPWAAGLLDSIIAADSIFKTSLSQKNRICLIILDSTLEIAYKEFLVNEKQIGIQSFNRIAQNRTLVENEVTTHLTISNSILAKIAFYYKLRCDLIHQRATPNITDTQIEDYRAIVEDLLQQMFGLDFI